MNKERREILSRATSMLCSVSELINRALDQEQDCLDNMPENLQDSERYQKMEAAVESLENAVNSVDDAKEYLETASE